MLAETVHRGRPAELGLRDLPASQVRPATLADLLGPPAPLAADLPDLPGHPVLREKP